MMISVRIVRPHRHLWARSAAVFGAFLLGILAAAMPGLAQSAAEWNVAKVGGPAVGTGVTVAVIDTGVDAGHPVFGGRVLPQIDIVDDGNDGDPNGHGTHVAGTVAGGVMRCAEASAKAIGVAPQTQILPVRVLDPDGSGTFEDVIKGIREAAAEGATVINLSLGDAGVPLPVFGSSSEQEFRQALADAWNKGSIPVLAAGNSRGDVLSVFRSGFEGIKAVVVTATDKNDNQPDYASSVASADWGIAAPGGSGDRNRDGFLPDPNVTSAWPDRQCAYLAGTSMATPHVSGALAVLRAHGLSKEDAVKRVLDTATDLSGNWDGSGRLDLTAALQGLGGTASPSGGSSTSAAPASPTTASTAPATTEAPASTAPSTSPAPSSTSTSEAGASTTTEPTSTTRAPDGPADIDDDDAGSASVLPDDSDDDGIGLLAAAAAVGACAFAWVLFGLGTTRFRA